MSPHCLQLSLSEAKSERAEANIEIHKQNTNILYYIYKIHNIFISIFVYIRAFFHL